MVLRKMTSANLHAANNIFKYLLPYTKRKRPLYNAPAAKASKCPTCPPGSDSWGPAEKGKVNGCISLQTPTTCMLAAPGRL